MQRYALKPFTFSNGQMVPVGTLLSCTSMSVHHDAENYTNADVFDPWRFSDMREGEGEAAKHQMVSTAPEFLAFGHGKHAWYVLASRGRCLPLAVLTALGVPAPVGSSPQTSSRPCSRTSWLPTT